MRYAIAVCFKLPLIHRGFTNMFWPGCVRHLHAIVLSGYTSRG